MLRGEGEGGITFEAIHGQDTAVIKAADLDLDRFLPPRAETPRSRAAPASELPAEPVAALLTGANGFLGRFLLLDLLQRVSKQCAPPVCTSDGRVSDLKKYFEHKVSFSAYFWVVLWSRGPKQMKLSMSKPLACGIHPIMCVLTHIWVIIGC